MCISFPRSRCPRLQAHLAFVAALGLMAYPLAAGADGGLWVDARTADEGHSADQRAILVYDAATATETLVLTTKYQGAPSDFAWVIPVPAVPERGQIRSCPEARWALESLSQATAPRAIEQHHDGAGCAGCASLATVGGGANATGGTTADVEVIERLSIDGLEISVVNAAAGADLAEWLNSNGYRFPAAGTAVADEYVARGWKFVAVKVTTAQERSRQGATWDAYFPQDPLRISFHSEQMVFPMRVSSLSTGAEGARVLLYVFADHRVKVANYPTVDVAAPGGVSSVGQFPAAYESLFQTLVKQPSGRAFVTEFVQKPYLEGSLASAGVLEYNRTYCLTRLRTLLRAEDMDEDVVLVPDAADTPVSVRVLIGSQARVPGTLVPVAACSACFGARRRRGIASRRAAKEALLLGLLLLAACFAL